VISGVLVTGNAIELAKDLPDESVDLICTDPPYALPEAWLYAWLSLQAGRLLRPGGYLLCLMSSVWTSVHLQALALSPALRYYASLAISHADGAATIWERNLMAAYKPVALFSKGQPAPTTMRVFNMVGSGGAKKAKAWHKWGQGLPPFLVWVEAFCPEGGLVLDPFAGGGTTLVAAKTIGRKWLGFEIDPAAADRARVRLAETQTQGKLWGQKQPELDLQ
jgi:site-specific DNA-methyltransferase (adenine-specific)